MNVVPVALEYGLAVLPFLDVFEGRDQTGGAGAEALAAQAPGAAEEKRASVVGTRKAQRGAESKTHRRGESESTISKHAIGDGQEGIIDITSRLQ